MENIENEVIEEIEIIDDDNLDVEVTEDIVESPEDNSDDENYVDVEDTPDYLEDDNEDDNEDDVLDKKERSIIRQKKHNKELKDSFKAIQLENEELRKRLELQKDGKSDEEIDTIIENEKESNDISYKLAVYEIKELSERFPYIESYSSELIKLKKTNPNFSYEELYKAKFSSNNVYDDKIKSEALKEKSVVNKQKAKTNQKTKTTKIRMSRTDAEAYSLWKATRPNGTPQQFLDILYN